MQNIYSRWHPARYVRTGPDRSCIRRSFGLERRFHRNPARAKKKSNLQPPIQPVERADEDATKTVSNYGSAMENRGRAPGSPDFGMLLRQYRLAAALSQEALAERARMSTQISALERGYRRTPQRETLSLLSGALALSDEQREEFEAAAARSVLLGRGASVTVGPWASASSATLPLAPTSFVGRETELDEIAALVRERRMVTVTGAGGVGKTQTALHAASALADAADIRVCFVGLAPIANPALVVAAIASSLSVQEMPDRSLLDTLLAYLKNKPLLLILDNCEHIIAAAMVAGALVAGCPRLRILATSREPLRAAGEHTYRLPSLSLPSPEASRRLGAADAAAYGAMVLFADSARAVDYHFALSDENAPIVRRTLPAPRRHSAGDRTGRRPRESVTGESTRGKARRSLSDSHRRCAHGPPPTADHARGDRLELRLTDGARAAGVRATLCLRRRLFPGSCVSGLRGEEAAEADVFEVLSSLVDKSLLVLSDFDGSEPRYRLLESSREYAREKLAERGEQEMVAQRHARAYIEGAWRVDAASDTQADLWNPLFPELDNWRAALEWALAARGDVALGQRLAGAWLMVIRVPVEGRRWINLALDLVDERTPANVLARIKLCKRIPRQRA